MGLVDFGFVGCCTFAFDFWVVVVGTCRTWLSWRVDIIQVELLVGMVGVLCLVFWGSPGVGFVGLNCVGWIKQGLVVLYLGLSCELACSLRDDAVVCLPVVMGFWVWDNIDGVWVEVGLLVVGLCVYGMVSMGVWVLLVDRLIDA